MVSSVLQPPTRLILLITIPNTSTLTTRNIRAPLFIRTNTKTSDNTIYLDISNPGYDGSSAVEKAALIIYGVKGYQTDVDGAVYDSVFAIDDVGDFSLQTNLDMNGFDIKNYDGYEIGYKLKKDLDLNGYSLKNQIENNTFKLKKDLDLNGYSLKNFQPRIIITGEWKFGENTGGNRTYVKFGNSVNMMSPFPCLLGGISALIIEKKDNSKDYDRIGFNIYGGLHGLLSDGPFQSVRNAGGLGSKYQYAEPHGGNEKLSDLDEDFTVYLWSHGDQLK